jgi:hypothetical protein
VHWTAATLNGLVLGGVIISARKKEPHITSQLLCKSISMKKQFAVFLKN